MQTNIYAKYHLYKHKEDILEENFKKPLVPYSHSWQDHCVYLYTYVYDELHFWYLKRVVTQMSRVSSFNVKNVSTWNNAVYYTHENYVFTFVLCLESLVNQSEKATGGWDFLILCDTEPDSH